MMDYWREEAEKLEAPKLTKEQKAAKKALIQICRASSASSKTLKEHFLANAAGLIESLLFVDDEEDKE